jgi:hypothetical protein
MSIKSIARKVYWYFLRFNPTDNCYHFWFMIICVIIYVIISLYIVDCINPPNIVGKVAHT